MTAMELHERLRQARQRKFKTAKAAADALGIPYGTLTGHEAGTRGVKSKELSRYARAYGVELAWLAHEIGPETKGRGAGPTTREERLILEAYRRLPEEEATAHLQLLLARTGADLTDDQEPSKKGQM